MGQRPCATDAARDGQERLWVHLSLPCRSPMRVTAPHPHRQPIRSQSPIQPFQAPALPLSLRPTQCARLLSFSVRMCKIYIISGKCFPATIHNPLVVCFDKCYSFTQDKKRLRVSLCIQANGSVVAVPLATSTAGRKADFGRASGLKATERRPKADPRATRLPATQPKSRVPRLD